ncbi:MAG: dienelactone hydrolase family protein [Hyphomonadaceae bacterium]|nr:dienelactone hydrolase family protein [Hyphomonadaceae bacterium]
MIELISPHDGARFSAHRVDPSTKPIGSVVVLQEIFGVTDHIKDMCARFAAAGYAAIAPSLFDRVEPGFQAGHDPDGVKKGIGGVMASPWQQVVSDIQACIDALPQPVYVTGFCYGGAAAWLAASHCTGLKAASCFYGRLIADLLDKNKPAIPVMLHYGVHDASIPAENYEKVRLAAPHAPLYLYDAGHGFCREASSDFHSASRDLAMTRTLDWFARWR